LSKWRLVAVLALQAAAAGAAPQTADSSAQPGGSAEVAPPRPKPAANSPDDSPADRFAAAAADLKRGAFERAIDELELLADQGFVHPDASFDRAVAYVARARSSQERPGDLGQAAAGFAETLELRPDDDEAEAALSRVRSEIARRRARGGAAPVAARPPLLRAVVGLVSESTWSIIALVGAALLTLGLGLRLFGSKTPTRLTGSVAAPIGGAALLLCGGLAIGASALRRASVPAVVVVSDARLLDEDGVPLRQVDGVPEHLAIPEGETVYVLERRGSHSNVEWGTTRGWVSTAQVRTLAR